LVKQGLCPSRQKAQALIMAGLVLVNNQKEEKAGKQVALNASLRVLGAEHPYVSRGGLKLAAALQQFSIKVVGKVCLDVGASTGGFTDCLLQNGAQKIYAIDVGYGQLAWKLRHDQRVVVLERTNMRALTPAVLYGLSPTTSKAEPPSALTGVPAVNQKQRASLAVIDVSFISLTKILPAVQSCLVSHNREIIALVKPQFEAGRAQVGKGGLVKDPVVQQQVCQKIKVTAGKLGFAVKGEMAAPITGADGNQEFLLYLV
jgi:23S rRNA (cytidine1920-2'-O)/16S rRNA (cytidine1409-2'-O)-methyltransferase